MNLIPNAWASDNIPWMLELLNSMRPRAGQEDLRGFEWHYWHRLAHSDLRTAQLAEPVPCVPTPQSLAPMQRDWQPTHTDSPSRASSQERRYKRTIRIWDTTSGQAVWTLQICRVR